MNGNAVAGNPDGQAIRFAVDYLDTHREEWFLSLVLVFVQDGLTSLRAYLDDPSCADITWEHPVAELRWHIAWNWEQWNATGPTWAGPGVEDLVNAAVAKGYQAVGEELAQQIFLNALLTLTSLAHLKDGSLVPYGCQVENNKVVPLLPQALVEDLQLDHKDAASRNSMIRGLFQPFTFDRSGLDRINPSLTESLAASLLHGSDGPSDWANSTAKERVEHLNDPLWFRLEFPGGQEQEVAIRTTVRPYVVDLDERKVYFPTTVSVVNPSNGEPIDLSNLDASQREDFWDAAFAVLGQYKVRDIKEVLLDVWHRTEKEYASLIGGPSKRQGTGDVAAARKTEIVPAIKATKPDKQIRFLFDSPWQADRNAWHLATSGRFSLPRSWGRVPHWTDLEKKEIAAIKKEFGDSAFEPGPDRPALLRKPEPRRGRSGRWETPEGEELTEQGIQRLQQRLSGKAYRKLEDEEDGVTREYLVIRIQLPNNAYIDARLTWYGTASKLIAGERAKKIQSFEEERRRLNGTFFEDLDQWAQQSIDRDLKHYHAIENGHLLMERLLAIFSQQACNPITVPAWELRCALHCEHDPNGMQRVRGCLMALQELKFSLSAASSQTTFKKLAGGPFITSFMEESRSAASPQQSSVKGDGIFHIHLGPAFIGCLRVFSVSQPQGDLTAYQRFNWNKPLSKPDRHVLQKEKYDQATFSVGAYLDLAMRFTPSQRNLFKWIDIQLTRNVDAFRKDRRAEDFQKHHWSQVGAKDPREYDASFCPLLSPGMKYHGALGHFSHYPESGFKLCGTGSRGSKSGGPITPGLASIMGYEFPPGKSSRKRDVAMRNLLADIRYIVEEVMGGVVAIFHANRWYRIEDVESIPEKSRKSEAKWLLFPAADWNTRCRRLIEERFDERAAKFDTPYLVRITEDHAVYKKSEEAISGAHRKSLASPVAKPKPPSPTVEQATSSPEDQDSPLHCQLRSARKARKLSQADVARIFGVSQPMIVKWELGPLPDSDGLIRGKRIPDELVPLVWRWVEKGEEPSTEELASRSTRRTGVKGIKETDAKT